MLVLGLYFFMASGLGLRVEKLQVLGGNLKSKGPICTRHEWASQRLPSHMRVSALWGSFLGLLKGLGFRFLSPK